MRDVVGKVGRGLLQQADPVLDREMAIPFVSQRSEGVHSETSLPDDRKLSAFDILLHLFEQVIPFCSFQSVKSFEDRIRDHPTPQGSAPSVIDPARMIVRRR